MLVIATEGKKKHKSQDVLVQTFVSATFSWEPGKYRKRTQTRIHKQMKTLLVSTDREEKSTASLTCR